MHKLQIMCRRIFRRIMYGLFRIHEFLVVCLYGSASKFCAFQLDSEILLDLKKTWNTLQSVEICEDSGNSLIFHSSHFAAHHYERINKDHAYRMISGELLDLIRRITSFHHCQILTATRSPYRVVNVRAWDCLFSSESSQAGTTGEWHKDMFVDGSVKLMLYLNPIDQSKGTTEFENYGAVCSEEPGCAILFDNNNLFHRAIRPQRNTKRPLIEVTLQRLVVPSFFNEPLAGTPNDRHLNNPIFAYILN